jgi:hypothetical protein
VNKAFLLSLAPALCAWAGGMITSYEPPHSGPIARLGASGSIAGHTYLRHAGECQKRHIPADNVVTLIAAEKPLIVERAFNAGESGNLSFCSVAVRFVPVRGVDYDARMVLKENICTLTLLAGCEGRAAAVAGVVQVPSDCEEPVAVE